MPRAPERTELPRFMQQQYAFAARIRDPQQTAAPDDVAPQRMSTYEELFYNNITDFLGNAFPVVRKLHTDSRWHSLVRDYYARHRARTPLFHEMPREFLHYLKHERPTNEEDYPFLYELAHYEWVELELLTSEDTLPRHLANGDLLTGIPLLSPLVRLLRYQFRVHQIGPDAIPQCPPTEETHLLVWRDLDDAIGFMELNPVSARLLQLLCEKPASTGKELLSRIAAELNHPNPATVEKGGLALLEELLQRGIILGTRPEGE